VSGPGKRKPPKYVLVPRRSRCPGLPGPAATVAITSLLHHGINLGFDAAPNPMMKRLLALVLLVGLAASCVTPLHAQQMSVAESQRKSAKEVRKQEKLMKKNARLQQKAQKRAAKAQQKSLKAAQKADAKANRQLQQRSPWFQPDH
jgi:uncharacterized protein HemX